MFELTRNPWTSRKTSGRRTSYKPRFEALERREVLSVTTAGLNLINSLPDTPVRTAALADYQRDGAITRNDMIQILHDGTDGFTYVLPGVLSSLQTLVNNGPTVGMPDYVQVLSSKVIAGVSGLGAAPAQTLDNNVNNFFFGLAHPAGYQPSTKPIWNTSTGPSYHDIVDDTRNMWSLESVAGGGYVDFGNPFLEATGAVARYYAGADIRQMFIDNGDNTYTIRIYNGSKPDYNTVDNYVEYGVNAGPYLWPALVARAFTQETGIDLLSYQDGYPGGSPAYYGVAAKVWAALTGQTITTSSTIDAGAIATAQSQGNYVVLQGKGTEAYRTDGKDELFGGEYAVLAADANNFTVAPVSTTHPYDPSFFAYSLEIPTSDLGDYFAGWYKVPPITIKSPFGGLLGEVASHLTDYVNFTQTMDVQKPALASTTVTGTLGTQQTLDAHSQSTTSSLSTSVLTTASTSPKTHVLSVHSLSDADLAATFGNLDSSFV
jgi:hypothetical protein